jgi:hypothetical protein
MITIHLARTLVVDFTFLYGAFSFAWDFVRWCNKIAPADES